MLTILETFRILGRQKKVQKNCTKMELDRVQKLIQPNYGMSIGWLNPYFFLLSYLAQINVKIVNRTDQ